MHFLGYNMLTKFQFHCSITCRDILYFVFWLPYWHTLWRHQYLICIIQKSWISLERDEIWQKGKHHSSSLLKAFQIRLFFNTSIFHFIGTLRANVQKNQTLSGKFQNFKITQTLAISGPYWTIYRCVVHLSNGVLFRQKMTILDFGARHWKIRLKN